VTVPTREFDMAFQKDTKSFSVYERRGKDGEMEVILYLPRGSADAKMVHVTVTD